MCFVADLGAAAADHPTLLLPPSPGVRLGKGVQTPWRYIISLYPSPSNVVTGPGERTKIHQHRSNDNRKSESTKDAPVKNARNLMLRLHEADRMSFCVIIRPICAEEMYSE